MGQDYRGHKRKLRNLLIDSKMQLRFLAVMVLLSIGLTAGLGYFWYAEMRKASEVIRVNMISALGEQAANQLGVELAAQDNQRLLLLAGFAVVFAILVAASGIVMSHKLAGPLFKISRHMKDIAGNRLYGLWGLRRGDQLQEFFYDFKTMHDALRERVQEDMRLLSGLIEAIERGGDLTEQLPALRQQLDRKGDSLRSAGDLTMRIRRPPDGNE